MVYDITRLDEKLEELPLFKMVRRDIVHDPKVQQPPESVKNALAGVPAEGTANPTPGGENASTGQEDA